MNILHIIHDYHGQKLYGNLLLHLASHGYVQTVFILNRTSKIKSSKRVYFKENIKFVELRINILLYQALRIFQTYRSKLATDYLLELNILEDISLIHAHTWFSAGGIGYRLKNIASKKYIITIRNSDINYIYKYFIFLRGLGKKIINNAESVQFLSESYREYVHAYVNTNNKGRIILEVKSAVIPNGIDQYWIDNKASSKIEAPSGTIKLLFVGEINRNKRIHFIIKTAEAIRSRGELVELVIIGGHKNKVKNKIYQYYIKYLVKGKSWVKYIDEIHERDTLLNYYRNTHIFIMPSKYESFGLVYLEALTQAVPVVYTKGQGFDDSNRKSLVGFPIDGKDVEEAIAVIYKIKSQYAKISLNCLDYVEAYSWENIADMQSKVYRSVS